jgi:hypothetical protein
MARWSKSKAKLETALPPLTTQQSDTSTTPNWHQMKMVEGLLPTALWTVTWDTRRQANAFNTAYHKGQPDAVDCAKRFLRLGFVVYSIKDPEGSEIMDETAINERFKPAVFS